MEENKLKKYHVVCTMRHTYRCICAIAALDEKEARERAEAMDYDAIVEEEPYGTTLVFVEDVVEVDEHGKPHLQVRVVKEGRG